MSAILKTSSAKSIAVLSVALAVGWIIYQSRETPESAAKTEPPRTPSRERPRLDRQSLPPDAHRLRTDQLRAWAAAMTDQELAQMINRVWADLPLEDKDPDPSTKTLLCALFREWGRRDRKAAFTELLKLDQEWSRRYEPGEVRRHDPANPLRHAIWAGYGERDPAGAWERLSGDSAMGGLGWIFADDDSPEMHAVLDSIFARLLAESPELAAESVEGGHRFRYVAMRTLLANMDDAEERLAQYYRWIPEAMNETISDPFSEEFQPHLIPYALTGIAMRDPEQAWQLAKKDDAEESFISEWARNQPEETLSFAIAKGEERLRYLTTITLLPTHPEQAIDCFSQMSWEAHVSMELPIGWPPSPHWPVAEGMKAGIPIENLEHRVRQALDENSIAPEERQPLESTLELND
jgi:hypothetical protein